MASLRSESLLNGVLIQMVRGFLQYVAESWPWVEEAHEPVRRQVEALAARQRQDVKLIAGLLTEREWSIDFGSFPTEYTDLHFISLSTMLDGLIRSQSVVNRRLRDCAGEVSSLGDDAAAELLQMIAVHESEILTALREVQQQFPVVPAPV